MKFLVTGRSGQVAWELRRSLAVLGDVISLGRAELDLEDPDAIRSRVRELRPDVIVNAAAYTAVDHAENEEDRALRVNGVAAGVLAEEALWTGAALVHYSTDYVFDGTKAEPYLEDDTPNPLSAYGRTKRAGELAIEAVGGRFLIFRTSWVYAPRGRNFMLTILRLARERDELRIINDQYGAPTAARVIADATAQILGRLRPASEWPSGIYNLTCQGRTTWFGFATEILALCQNQVATRRPALHPISTEQYPLPARRPVNSVLDGSKLHATFGLTLPDWRTSLRLCVEELPA